MNGLAGKLTLILLFIRLCCVQIRPKNDFPCFLSNYFGLLLSASQRFFLNHEMKCSFDTS